MGTTEYGQGKNASGRGMRTGSILFAVVLIGAAAIIGFSIGHETRGSATGGGTPVSEDVAAGAHDFITFGCESCHGLGGKGGVSIYVPALTGGVGSLTFTQLDGIINHGLGVVDNPQRP